MRKIAALIVLVFLFCGGLYAAETAETQEVYLLCKSETGKFKVINTTPDKVMYELKQLKDSANCNYTVMVSGDTGDAGYYMISVGDKSPDEIAGRAPVAGDDIQLMLGGLNPGRWFERLPVLICTEAATAGLLITLLWYYKRRKLPRQNIR
jgi:hypothetical protein